VFPVVRDVKDMRVTGWCAIAGTATLIMLGFFCAALFLWMAEWSGPIVACLMLGGIFLLIMIMAAIVFANVRRRRAQRPGLRMPTPPPSAGEIRRSSPQACKSTGR
jgi:hypothetical protein